MIVRHTLIVDLTITINVRFTDHLIDFIITELLACSRNLSVNDYRKGKIRYQPRLVITCLSSAAEM